LQQNFCHLVLSQVTGFKQSGPIVAVGPVDIKI
jgi:hypothetical protein